MHITTIVLIGLLLAIVVYDFKHMAIPLYVLLLAVITALIRLLLLNSVKPALSFLGINLLGCASIVLFSFIALFLLRKKVFNPLISHIGAGDLLFFPVLCASFSPLNFILFFVMALALVLVIKPVFFRLQGAFPLAGSMAVLFAAVLVVTEIMAFNLFNDNAVIHFIVL